MKIRRLLIRLLVLGVVIGALVIYQAGRELQHMPRLQANPARVVIPAEGESFPSFRQRAGQALLAAADIKATKADVQWLEPFDIAPVIGCDPAQDHGVLLFHGLTDSPFSLRDLSGQLSAACQTVRVVLLPGHGTVPGDLSLATLEDWRLTVDRSVAVFQQDHPGMILGGYSLGGALAVDFVLRHPEQPLAALLLVAPALALDSAALWALPVLQRLSGALPRLAWLEIHDDENPVKYESFPVNGAWQMARLANELAHHEQNGQLPVWAALTADDATVDARASLDQLCALADPGKSRLLWYANEAYASCDPVVWEKPSADVLDYSHLALPFSPVNPVYGEHPLYYNCVHYPAHELQWRLCKGLETLKDTVPMLGEITPQNLELPLLRRLTYNPSFDAMSADVRAFIHQLPIHSLPAD